MVKAACPPYEINAWAKETALKLLRSMADRGNTYLDSRHSLLLELQAAIGLRPAEEKETEAARSLATSQKGPVTPIRNSSLVTGHNGQISHLSGMLLSSLINTMIQHSGKGLWIKSTLTRTRTGLGTL